MRHYSDFLGRSVKSGVCTRNTTIVVRHYTNVLQYFFFRVFCAVHVETEQIQVRYANLANGRRAVTCKDKIAKTGKRRGEGDFFFHGACVIAMNAWSSFRKLNTGGLHTQNTRAVAKSTCA